MSKSRSKTRRTSRSTPKSAVSVDALTIQRNLLSLISHELRTPLSGILQSLDLVKDSGEGDRADLIETARSQAKRLEHTLAHILDISAFDSQHFGLRLREGELKRSVNRAERAAVALWPKAQVHVRPRPSEQGRVLIDSQRFERAVLLVMDACMRSGAKGCEIDVGECEVIVDAAIDRTFFESWDEEALAARTSLEAGFGARELAFPDAALTEAEFLTRSREGLAGGLALAAFVLKAHGGKLVASRKGSRVSVSLTLPRGEGESLLRAVLESRAFDASTGVTSVGLILLRSDDPKLKGAALVEHVRARVFRSSDSVYSLTPTLVAVVLADCRPADLPVIARRMADGQKVVAGYAHCPEDDVDPDRLLALAKSRLRD